MQKSITLVLLITISTVLASNVRSQLSQQDNNELGSWQQCNLQQASDQFGSVTRSISLLQQELKKVNNVLQKITNTKCQLVNGTNIRLSFKFLNQQNELLDGECQTYEPLQKQNSIQITYFKLNNKSDNLIQLRASWSPFPLDKCGKAIELLKQYLSENNYKLMKISGATQFPMDNGLQLQVEFIYLDYNNNYSPQQEAAGVFHVPDKNNLNNVEFININWFPHRI